MDYMDYVALKRDAKISAFLDSQFLKGNYHRISRNGEVVGVLVLAAVSSPIPSI